VLLSCNCCSSGAQPSWAWLHELTRSTALLQDYALSPCTASKWVFTPILSLSLLLLQTMHAFVLSSSGLERPAINSDMNIQPEKASSLIVSQWPVPSTPKQYLSNRSFCMLLPRLPALSGFAAYVAKCSHQLSESQQMCHSSCDHSLSIQPNAKGNVVGQLVGQLVGQRPSTT